VSTSPCSGAAGDEYRSPDYRWSERLRGVGMGVKALDLGAAGFLQAYGFVSHQTHDIYQYEIYDRGRCAGQRIRAGCIATSELFKTIHQGRRQNLLRL